MPTRRSAGLPSLPRRFRRRDTARAERRRSSTQAPLFRSRSTATISPEGDVDWYVVEPPLARAASRFDDRRAAVRRAHGSAEPSSRSRSSTIADLEPARDTTSRTRQVSSLAFRRSPPGARRPARRERLRRAQRGAPYSVTLLAGAPLSRHRRQADCPSSQPPRVRARMASAPLAAPSRRTRGSRAAEVDDRRWHARAALAY